MLKRKREEKHIGDDDSQKYELIPNVSLGVFVLGKDISAYLHMSHFLKHEDFETFSSDDYEFYDGGIIVWTRDEDKNKIWTIRSNSKCYWKGENLIGMPFDKFLRLSENQPNTESTEYVPINRNRGQNQKVYTFDNLGLMIWVWRNRIKTILISRYDQGE